MINNKLYYYFKLIVNFTFYREDLIMPPFSELRCGFLKYP